MVRVRFRPSRRVGARSGFTLVEVLVVLAVLGLLAAAVSLVGVRSLNRSRQAEAMRQMKYIATSLAISASNTGRYPQALGHRNGDDERKDPWGHLFVYRGGGDTFELRCLGRDGVESAGITPETRDEFDLDIVMRDGVFVNRPFA